MHRFAAYGAAFLALWAIGCGGAEKEKPRLIYAASDPLCEAWVIEGPTRSQPETGIGVIRIRASSPDDHGAYKEGGALVGLEVDLRINDRVITRVYQVFDEEANTYREVRLASKDLRFRSNVRTDKPLENPQFLPSPDDSPSDTKQPPE